MACMYSDFDGNCELFDEGIEQNGCDETGACCCEDDPDPSIMCEEFESIDSDENDG